MILMSSVESFAVSGLSVTTTNVNLREENSVDSKSLIVLNEGDTVEVLYSESDWVKVNYNNLQGFISANYLKEIDLKIKTESKQEGFSDQKGFVAGFKYIFTRAFIIIILAGGGLFTYTQRKRDNRFKTGFRETKLNDFTIMKIAFFSFILSVGIGFFGGLISLFH